MNTDVAVAFGGVQLQQSCPGKPQGKSGCRGELPCSTVGTTQPHSTQTFAFRIITPGLEELTQMVSKLLPGNNITILSLKVLPPTS